MVTVKTGRRVVKKTTTSPRPRKPGTASKAAGLNSDTVQKKTGRSWAEWLTALDDAGARKLSHAEIAQMVHDKFGVGDWWAQMVTVGYEQLAGKRVIGQKADGFAATASRTFDAPAARVWEAFHNPRRRAHWLTESLTITTATSPKSLRISWGDGKTRVDVNIYANGPSKTQMSLQHNKLARAADVARMKAFWSAALDRLRLALDWETRDTRAK